MSLLKIIFLTMLASYIYFWHIFPELFLAYIRLYSVISLKYFGEKINSKTHTLNLYFETILFFHWENAISWKPKLWLRPLILDLSHVKKTGLALIIVLKCSFEHCFFSTLFINLYFVSKTFQAQFHWRLLDLLASLQDMFFCQNIQVFTQMPLPQMSLLWLTILSKIVHSNYSFSIIFYEVINIALLPLQR